MDDLLRAKLAREMTHTRPIQSERPLADWLDSMNTMQKVGLLNVPLVSDAAGLLGDVQMYREQPEQRGLFNYAMTGLGLLPFVPGVLRNVEMDDAARMFFGTTDVPKRAGFVLDNGDMLDMVPPEVPKTGIYGPFHPDIARAVPGADDIPKDVWLPGMAPSERSYSPLHNYQNQTGAVRYRQGIGISVLNTNMPSQRQIEKVVKDFREYGAPLAVDVDDYATSASIASKEFKRPTVDAVMEFIRKHQQ